MLAEFKPSPGFENCPKCGGWQVLDITIRDKKGWPIGPVVHKHCDHCEGRGEIRNTKPEPPKPITIRDNKGLAVPWGSPVEPGPVKVTPEPVASPSDPVASGWAIFDKDK